jgi:hypothetical protein
MTTSTKLPGINHHYGQISRKALSFFFFVIFYHLGIKAQDAAYIRPSWWFGVSGGINMNFYQGKPPHLINSHLSISQVVQNEMGIGQ